MEPTDNTVTAVFIVTALAVPLVLAESSGEDVQEGAPEHQYKNEKRLSDEERDARQEVQAEEGACGADD